MIYNITIQFSPYITPTGEYCLEKIALFSLLRLLQIVLHHNRNQFFQANFGFPAHLLVGFGGITDQNIYFRRAKIARVNSHDHPAGLFLDAFFFHAATFPDEFPSQILCGVFDGLPNGIGLSGSNDKICYA